MTTKRKKAETHLVEWKESWRNEYLKWLCGFANADSGTLIIEMNDKGEPVGAPIAGRLLVDLQTTSQPHNPDTANTYFRTGLIEAWGRRYEQGAPEATVESDGNGAWVERTSVNPTSDADRIRPRDTSPGQVAGQATPPVAPPVTPPVTDPVTDPVGRLLRALDAGSQTPSHIQAALGLKHRSTFEWRGHD